MDEGLVDDDVILGRLLRYAAAIARRDRGVLERGDVSADDVAQDIAVQFLGLAEPPRDWKAWVGRATRNKLIDLARQRRPELVEDQILDYLERRMGPSAGVIARHELAEVLATVSEKHRDVFNDHLAGMSHAEIAERYGYASAATVTTIVSRVASRLRAAFPLIGRNLAAQRVYSPRLPGRRRTEKQDRCGPQRRIDDIARQSSGLRVGRVDQRPIIPRVAAASGVTSCHGWRRGRRRDEIGRGPTRRADPADARAHRRA